jgi:hypothetical protein
MSKVCFYIMTEDTGFAPNPDFGVCTLATCKPNHMRASLTQGDFIVGLFRGSEPTKVVYVMMLDQVLTLHDYFSDRRFARKKPTRRYKQGDNLYHTSNRTRVLARGAEFDGVGYHQEVEKQNRDTKGNRVFVGRDFIYLGGKAKLLPDWLAQFITKGCRHKYLCEHEDRELFGAFRRWWPTIGGGKMGKLAMPRDYEPPEEAPRKRGGCGLPPRPESPCSLLGQ